MQAQLVMYYYQQALHGLQVLRQERMPKNLRHQVHGPNQLVLNLLWLNVGAAEAEEVVVLAHLLTPRRAGLVAEEALIRLGCLRQVIYLQLFQ
jgi:hypothetical protein